MYWLNPLGDLVPQWYSITRHLQYTKQVLEVFNIPYPPINPRGKAWLQQLSLHQEYCYNEHSVPPLELWLWKQDRRKFLTLLWGENFHLRLGVCPAARVQLCFKCFKCAFQWEPRSCQLWAVLIPQGPLELGSLWDCAECSTEGNNSIVMLDRWKRAMKHWDQLPCCY